MQVVNAKQIKLYCKVSAIIGAPNPYLFMLFLTKKIIPYNIRSSRAGQIIMQLSDGTRSKVIGSCMSHDISYSVYNYSVYYYCLLFPSHIHRLGVDLTHEG